MWLAKQYWQQTLTPVFAYLFLRIPLRQSIPIHVTAAAAIMKMISGVRFPPNGNPVTMSAILAISIAIAIASEPKITFFVTPNTPVVS
jgi:hypothetical protein